MKQLIVMILFNFCFSSIAAASNGFFNPTLGHQSSISSEGFLCEGNLAKNKRSLTSGSEPASKNESFDQRANSAR